MSLSIDTIIFVGFLMTTFILGLVSSRGVAGIKEYAIGDRNFSTATIVATIVATFVAGGFFYNNIYETYTGGLYSIWVLAGDSISLLLTGMFFAPRMKEFLGKLSIAEAMGDLYGKNVRVITAILGFIGAAGAIAIQLRLAGLIFEYAFQIPSKYGATAAAIIITLYSSLGGIKSVTFTDIIQFFTFGVVIPVIAYVLLVSIDDFSRVTEMLATNPLFDYKQVFNFSNALSFNKLFLLLFFITPGFTPVLFQRIAMAKNTKQISSSFIIASIVCLVLSLILNWIGILILSINPSLKGDEVIRYVIFNSYYTGITGAALAGIMAMLMSTADSWINSASILVVHDFCKPLEIKPVKNELLFARIISLCIGIFSLLLSLYKGSLLDLVVVIFSFYMPIVSVPFIMAVLGFRSSGKSVILGMVAGLTTVLLWDYVLQIKAANSIPAGMLANLILLMGSHYLLKQKGGWVGIKDDSEVIEAQKIRRRKLTKFLTDLKSLNLIEICKNNSPKGDGLTSILGFFLMISVFGSTHTLAKEYQVAYKWIIDILYPMTLCSTSILISYPLWLQPWKETSLISVFWNIIAFSVLICFSFLMALFSQFSEIQLMAFMVNVIVVALFSNWRWSLLTILVGVSVTSFWYTHYLAVNLTDNEMLFSEFKIIYLLLLIGSLLVLFLKPKQDYQLLTEEKNSHLVSRISFQGRELQKALALKSEFIRNISHEYHAPMVGISSMAAVLEESYENLTDQQRKTAINTIVKSSARLEVFDANISSLAKLSKPNCKLKLELIDLSNLLYERVDTCRKLYEENHEDREFILNIADRITTNGDKYYLTQLLDNLLINAISYCKKGRIFISLEQSQTDIKFSISDEGIGIPPEELEDIFGEFTVSSKTHTQAGGRGVGLALCKRVAEVHGGSIKAESDGIKGSTISFIISPDFRALLCVN